MIRLILRSARRGSAVIVVEFLGRRRTMALMQRVAAAILTAMREVVPVQSGALRESLATNYTMNTVELSGLVYLAATHFRSRRNRGWIGRGLERAQGRINAELLFENVAIGEAVATAFVLRATSPTPVPLADVPPIVTQAMGEAILRNPPPPAMLVPPR